MHFIVGACLTAFVIAATAANPPGVENRRPNVDEIGYQPADKSTVTLNPPSLTWLHESPARRYTVQWSRSLDFSRAVTVSNLSFNTYTHSETLAPGTYFWRYRFTTAAGEESTWSQARQFSVPASATAFPLPSVEQRRKLLPEGHPRLFVRPEDLPRLRAAATGSSASRFAPLRARADKLLGQPLTPEPKEPGTATVKTNVTLLQNWWANRVQTLRACEEAETVAFVYLVTGDAKYGQDARRRILDLAAWDPDGETNFRRNCEAGKPLLHRLSRAADWAWDTLSPAERQRVQAAVKRRIQDAWESGEVGRGVGHINRPFNSHGNRTWHKIGESAIVFLGEIPEAELWLDYALHKFYACYPVWADEEGGWHEGLSYWGGYMSKAVWWLQAAQTALNIDGFKKPFFSHIGDYALYMAPPGSSTMGFGDLSGREPSQSWGGFLEYYLRGAARLPGSNARYWRWWSDQWNMEPQDGIFGFLYEARLAALPEPKPPVDLPASKIFFGIGVASLHTTLLNAKDDVHFLFKSSPFGSMSHGHNSQNSFQLSAYGETLLPACVYRDWHGTTFHTKWVHQTVSQNALLVNGKGQLPHHGNAQGRIAASELTPTWDYIVGDAAPAYEGRLERCLRHVVFVKPGLLVLCDELVAHEPSTFQVMLHALSPFDLQTDAQRLHIQRQRSGLTVQYLTAKPLALRQWDGFEPKPMRGDFANHWHLEAGTREKARQAHLITLLAPHRGSTAPELAAERLESDSAVGVRARLGEEVILIAIRKADAKGPAQLAGKTFDRAVMVERK